MPDCGASGCTYAKKRTGMRPASGCHCDACPHCGMYIRPTSPQYHRDWCKMYAWIPPHHRGKMGVRTGPIPISAPLGPPKPLLIMYPVKIEDDPDSGT